ncbi:MAG: PaaI family thioesterase [Sphingomicrobium sp.]
MPPDAAPPPDAVSGEQAHLRALESLYRSAPVNALFDSRLTLPAAGRSEIFFTVAPALFHAAGAAHGTLYFKMLDDAAFYAANSIVSDRFLLTTAFNLHFTKPLKAGEARAEGRWISGRRRVFVAEARIVDSSGEECARGTGTFLRSHIALAGLDGYRQSD